LCCLFILWHGRPSALADAVPRKEQKGIRQSPRDCRGLERGQRSLQGGMGQSHKDQTDEAPVGLLASRKCSQKSRAVPGTERFFTTGKRRPRSGGKSVFF